MFDIDIKFDTSSVKALKEALGSQKGLTEYVNSVAEEAKDVWAKKAEAKLGGSADTYTSGLSFTSVGRARAKVVLSGFLPNLLEGGTSGWDLRATLLRPFGLDKRVIPFRHTTPRGSTSSGIGVPMGSQYTRKVGPTAAKKLGNEVYKTAKRLQKGQVLPPGTGGAPLLNPTNKTDIYAGMRKQTKGKKTEYMTFRTISENQDPSTWRYPSKDALDIVDEVVDELPNIAERMINAILDGIK